MEFKEFKPRFKSAKIRQNPVKMKRRLKSRNISYHFKWNQAYLNRGLNLNRRSNSLNSAIGLEKLDYIYTRQNTPVGIWLRYNGSDHVSVFRTFI